MKTGVMSLQRRDLRFTSFSPNRIFLRYLILHVRQASDQLTFFLTKVIRNDMVINCIDIFFGNIVTKKIFKDDLGGGGMFQQKNFWICRWFHAVAAILV